MAENEKQASEASKANKENLSYQKRRMKQNSELLSQGNEALKQDYQRLNVAKELNQLAEKAVQHKFDTSNALRDISNIEQDIKDILKLQKNSEGEQLELTKKIHKELEQELKTTKNIADAMGMQGKAIGVINKLLGGSLADTKKIEEATKRKLKDLQDERS